MKTKKRTYDQAIKVASVLDTELSLKSRHIIEVGVDVKSSIPSIYVEIDDICARKLIPTTFKGFKIKIIVSAPAQFTD